MSMCEKILLAHECYTKMSNDCERCRFGYGKLDDSGDNKFWTCDYEKLVDDMISLLLSTRRSLSIISFMLEEYMKPDSEKGVIPFKTTEAMANYFHMMVDIINKDYE